VAASGAASAESSRTPVSLDPKRLLLTTQDVPSGFDLTEEEQLDNRTVARSTSDPDKSLENYESWGRIDGWNVSYETGVFKESISSSAVVYRTQDGARNAFNEQLRGSESGMREEYEDSTVEVTKFEELEGIDLGDQIKAFHMTVTGRRPRTPFTMDYKVIAFRRSNVIAAVSWTSFEEKILTDDVRILARRIDERILSALRP
jgi:hypothetical protein